MSDTAIIQNGATYNGKVRPGCSSSPQSLTVHCRAISFIRQNSLLVLFLVLGAYVAAYLMEFVASPLGRFPMLDAAEHLDLARRIAAGTLPAEPFYRAMLYPGLLSLFLRAGLPIHALPTMAGILGCCVHLASTFCVYKLAHRSWTSPRAGVLAAALFGFNPVAIYFAVEPLDTTLALFLFLAGLTVLHPLSLDRNVNPRLNLFRPMALATLCWSLAMLARPHYAIVLAGLPFLLAVFFWRAPRQLISALSAFFLVAGTCLGTTGLLQKKCCGEFRVMPTQGAYSLWVGNRPGANGRYYEQQTSLPTGMIEHGQNPARVESELLYRRETGDTGTLTPDHVNAHWKGKTFKTIRAQPLAWMGLMARKTYYLFNNFEQYNNKTFAVQKDLSSVLRLNPLCWGITFVLCGAGVVMAALLRRTCAGATFAMVVAGVYGAGVILFFVSDRFRLPLLPFACVGAGAWGWISAEWSSVWRSNKLVITGFVAAFLASITFSRAWDVHDLSPVAEDYVALSIAAGESGEDLDGLRWARYALASRPDHPAALARAVTSFYNLNLQGANPERVFSDESWDLQCDRVAKIPQPSPGVRLVQAVALWKTTHPEAARSALRSLLNPALIETGMASATTTADDALGVLLLAGLDEAADQANARKRIPHTGSFYLLAALARREADISLIPEARRQTLTQAEPLVRNLFP